MGHDRLGAALDAMGKLDEAILSYKKGRKLNPSSERLKTELRSLRQEQNARAFMSGYSELFCDCNVQRLELGYPAPAALLGGACSRAAVYPVTSPPFEPSSAGQTTRGTPCTRV